MMSCVRGILLACGCALLSACAIGPDYKRPSVDVATGYKEVDGWKPTEPADALARGPWWHIFNDGVLNGLEDQIDISNQNIKAAAAAVEQSQALVREAQAGYWPTLSVSASRTHGRRGGGAQPSSGSGAAPSNSNSGGASSGGGQYNSNSAGASLNWPLDIWGTVRRSVEGAKADEQTGEATLANARLSAQAQLASSYFQLRYQDQLQIILDDTVKADDLALKITENRYRVGVAARADVVQAQTQLLSAQAQQVNVAVQRGTLEHAIAVLVGQQPATFAVAPATIRSDVPTVPAGLPSDLLERRPDIAEAERKVTSANAQIGVAKGAYFPSFSITGTLDYAAGGPLAKLFQAPNQTWSVGPGLSQILFAGGLHRAQVAAAKANWEISVDNYRQAVLEGFQQVEDQLVTLRVLEQQSIVEDKLVLAAREAERLTLNEYKAGTVDYSSVITTQTARLQSEQSALLVFLDRLTASVTLIEALGGGWSTSQLRPAPPASTSTSPPAAPLPATPVRVPPPLEHPPAQQMPPKKPVPDSQP